MLQRIGGIGVGNCHRSIGVRQGRPGRPIGQVGGTLQVISEAESAGERELKRTIR